VNAISLLASFNHLFNLFAQLSLSN